MDKKKLLIHIVLLMFFIFILDRLSARFYWYYSIWWFDMPMHFLGGLWVGLFFIYILVRKKLTEEASTRQILNIILQVFFMGVIWEIFEFKVNNVMGRMPFNTLDTISDLFFDLSGAFLAMSYFVNKIMSTLKSGVQLN